MKKLFITIILAATGSSLLATVRTVSNTPSTIAQFNTILGAVVASSTGDTVYIHGSPNQYGGFTISNKKLVIIGPGFSPDKNMPFTAVVQSCTITGAASANTEIQGLVFVGILLINSAAPNNLRFIRNKFVANNVYLNEGGITYNGYLFEGNLFDNGTIIATPSSTYQNFLFQNNYFYESGCCTDGNIVGGWFNCISVVFNHNLWFGPGSATRNITDGNSNRFLTFTNNIFVRRNFSGKVSLSTFSNNITFNAGVNDPWLFNSNVDGGGNVVNQDPQMADQAAVNAGTNNGIGNYTIAAGPAKNSGSDGKDIGLLYDVTGGLNFTNSRNNRLPRIISMNLPNPAIPVGGTLEVNLKAVKAN